MNTHKNARLTFARRIEMVQDMTDRGMSPAAAAAEWRSWMFSLSPGRGPRRGLLALEKLLQPLFECRQTRLSIGRRRALTLDLP